MIVEPSFQAVEASHQQNGFVLPLYGSYCFGSIAGTILDLFGAAHSLPRLPACCVDSAKPQKVVFMFLDAFGWRLYQQSRGASQFLSAVAERGKESKLTAIFPSNTGPSVTAVNTGLTASQSGIIEWLYYEPLLGESIYPLLFSTVDCPHRETLAERGVDPRTIFPFRTIYQRLAEHGVGNRVVQPAEFTPSSFSSAVLGGGNFIPYRSLVEGLYRLADEIEEVPGPCFYYFYYGGFDSLMHTYMVTSRYIRTEIELFFEAFDRIVFRRLTSSALFLVSADHGQMGSETHLYINELLPQLSQWLRPNRYGQPIAPAGGARDIYLYVRDECEAEALQTLREALQGKAEVALTRDIYHLFGTAFSERFYERVGNITILPLEDECIWWNDPPRLRIRHPGHHGGLSAAEMEVPFLALNI